MRWDSIPFKNSKDMKTLGGLFNNHGNMPILLKMILYNQAKNHMPAKRFLGGVPSNYNVPSYNLL
jgi:hypothetical protein